MKVINGIIKTNSKGLTSGFAFTSPYKSGRRIAINMVGSGIERFARMSTALGQRETENFICDGMRVAVETTAKAANKYWRSKCICCTMLAGSIGYLIGKTDIERNKVIITTKDKETEEIKDETVESDS